jgi:hypothetical protein
MTLLDQYLQQVFPKDRIFEKKPIPHWMWEHKGGHLFNTRLGNSERYIYLSHDDDFSIDNLEESISIIEVIEENSTPEEYGMYEGITEYLDEIDWLGMYVFLTFVEFRTLHMRELVENNYKNLIFFREKSWGDFKPGNMDFKTGNTFEDEKWAFFWIKHDSPFYMEEGILLPRKNTVSDHAGVIWFETKADADIVIDSIYSIAQRVGNGFLVSNTYPTPESFQKDFLSLMRKLSKGLISIEDIRSWETASLSGFRWRK